jgi:membrane protein DedA with SNARE-associated domain
LIPLPHLDAVGWLGKHGYVMLLPLAVLEGPTVTIIAGFLASVGRLSLLISWPIVVVGDLVGDSLYYSLGRWGGLKFVGRWGRYCGITSQRLELVEQHFQRHTGRTLLLGKMTIAIGVVLLVAAGIGRVPFRKFLWFNFLASIPKSLVFLLIGFTLGQAYSVFNGYAAYASFAAVGLAAFFLVTYLTLWKAGIFWR